MLHNVIMNQRKYLAIIPVSLIILSLFVIGFHGSQKPKEEPLDLFVGVDVAYADLPVIKRFVDEISNYTNLFVIGWTGITYNSELLNETCQYVYDHHLSFIVYTDVGWYFRTEWLEYAQQTWGNKFLGLYAMDEVGGKQLDLARWIKNADNYAHASTQFVQNISNSLIRITRFYTDSVNFPVFTSDYALYWFDYKAGYDTVFAEFGWNYSRQLNLALCRGAATVNKRDWGVMITWTYNHPPYIESGKKLYDDMILAYENGAKYIVIFDSNEEYTESILTEEHLEALKQFWEYTQDNPRTERNENDGIAYVLPKDYAYGFRGPQDKIWGLWEADSDSLSLEISQKLGGLLREYGTKLDIIYDDEIEFNELYSKYIFWNGTTYIP
jgi:hypothetical protein